MRQRLLRLSLNKKYIIIHTSLMEGKDKSIKFFWPTKKENLTSIYLFLQKIRDAAVTAVTRTADSQVRWPVSEQPSERSKVPPHSSSPQSPGAPHRSVFGAGPHTGGRAESDTLEIVPGFHLIRNNLVKGLLLWSCKGRGSERAPLRHASQEPDPQGRAAPSVGQGQKASLGC